MAFIRHYQGLVFFGQGHNFIQLRDGTIHREDPVCDNDFLLSSCSYGILKLLLQIFHVVVLVSVAHGLAKTHPINDRGVIQGV